MVGNSIQGRASLSARSANAVAVAALFALDQQRAFQLQWGSTLEVPGRERGAAPGIHSWRPGRERTQICEDTQREEDGDHAQHRDWPSSSALFAGTGNKRDCKEESDGDHRSDQ